LDDVIELLREVSEDVPVPLELPDEDLLVEIEEQLLLALPDDLRYYLLEASDLIVGTLEPVTVADARSHTYLPEVAAQAWNDGMPRHLLPVCQRDDGYYCISEDGEIRYWNGHKLGKDPDGAKEWPSLWDWAREVWLPTANA
jgi:hypothetical protein